MKNILDISIDKTSKMFYSGLMNNTAAKTKTQISKAMLAAGITGELSGRGTNWEVEVADEKTMRKFCKQVANVGGFKTGYGAWVLQSNYIDLGDPMDKGSLRNYA